MTCRRFVGLRKQGLRMYQIETGPVGRGESGIGAFIMAEFRYPKMPMGHVAWAVPLLLLISGAWFSLQKPFVMDEMEFPSVAKAIVQTGKPVYYRGETNPANTGLWHPPLYVLALAGWQALLGFSSEATRSFGLFNFCLIILAITGFSRLRMRTEAQPAEGRAGEACATLVGLCAVATSPLIIQGSSLPDIDSQFLPLLIVLFFLALFEVYRLTGCSKSYWACFIVGMSILLFAKLTSALVVVPSLVMFQMAAEFGHRKDGGVFGWISIGRVARSAVLAILGSVAALILLLVQWKCLAAAWQVDFWMPFEYLLHSTNNPASFGSGLGKIAAAIVTALPHNYSYFCQWVGVPLLLAVPICFWRETRQTRDGLLALRERWCLYTFVLCVQLVYTLLRPAPFEFPKYILAMVPAIGLLIIDLLIVRERNGKAQPIMIAIGIVAVAFVGYSAVQTIGRDEDFIKAMYVSPGKCRTIGRWIGAPCWRPG